MEDLENVMKAIQQLRTDILEMEKRSEDLENENSFLRQDTNRLNSEICRYDLLNQELRENNESNELKQQTVEELMEEERTNVSELADYLQSFEGSFKEIQNQINFCEERLRPIKIAQIQVDKELTRRQKKVEELKVTAKEEEQKVKDQDCTYDKLQQELDSLLKQTNVLRDQDCASKAEIFELSNQLHQLEIEEETQKKELDQENSQLKELEELKVKLETKLSTNIEETDKEVKELVEQNGNLKLKIKELEQDLSSKKLKTQNSEKYFENIQASILDTKNQINELQVNFERNQATWPSELEKLNEEIAKLEQRNLGIQSVFLKEIDSLNNSLDNQRAINLTLKCSVDETNTKLQENQLKIEDNKTTVLEIKKEKDAINDKINESKSNFEAMSKELNQKESDLKQKIVDSKGNFLIKKEKLLKQMSDLKSNKDKCQNVIIPELQQEVTKVEEDIQKYKQMLLEFEMKRKEGSKRLSELLEANKTKIEVEMANMLQLEYKASFQDAEFALQEESFVDQIANLKLETMESEAFLNSIAEESDKISFEIETCENNVAQVKLSTEILREEIVKLKNDSKEERFNEAQTKLAQLHNENKILSSNIDDMKEKIEISQSEKEKLQTEITSKVTEIDEIKSSVATMEMKRHEMVERFENGHIQLEKQLLEYKKLKHEQDCVIDEKKIALCALEDEVQLKNDKAVEQQKINQNKENKLEVEILETQRKSETLETDLKNLEETNKKCMKKKVEMERSIEELVRQKREKTKLRLGQISSQRSLTQQPQKGVYLSDNTLPSSSSYKKTPSVSQASTIPVLPFKEPKKTLKPVRAKTSKKASKKKSKLTVSPITPQRDVMVLTDEETEDKEQKRKPRLTAEAANSRIRSVFSDTSVEELPMEPESFKRNLFRSPPKKVLQKTQSFAPAKKNTKKDIWDLTITDTSLDEEPQETFSIAPVNHVSKPVMSQYSRKKTSTKNYTIFSDTSLSGDQDTSGGSVEVKDKEAPPTQKVDMKANRKKFFKSKDVNTKKIYGSVINLD